MSSDRRPYGSVSRSAYRLRHVVAPGTAAAALPQRHRQEAGQHPPRLGGDRPELRPRRDHREGRRGDRAAGRRRPHGHPRLPRRGHPRRRPGRGHGGGVRRPAQAALGRRAAGPGRGVGEAVGDRPGAARRRSQDRARERPHHLPGRPQRRHHGHPGHGGPHHHRLDAGDPARPAQGLPRDRRGAAGLPAPHRGRLPRARPRGVAGPAVQGRLQRARRGRLPGTRSRSTSPTCAASRCCSPGRATR